jgi:putative transposase
MRRPHSERRSFVSKESKLSISKQCSLLGLQRSGLYYRPAPESEENLRLMRLMDEQYIKTPFYGIRRMKEWLVSQGYVVNRKRVSRLLSIMGWQTIYRPPKTSVPDKSHKIYPYLLRGLRISRSNEVWAMDITYVPMQRGYLYLCAIIDVHPRFVVGWDVSNSMTAEWCTGVVNEAIAKHGKPDIFNTDQGAQFTSLEFTSNLKDKQILISMDGKGRAIDNIFIERLWRTVKYEHIYLHCHEDGVKLYAGLKEYFTFYNTERKHQSLDYLTPKFLYSREKAEGSPAAGFRFTDEYATHQMNINSTASMCHIHH